MSRRAKPESVRGRDSPKSVTQLVEAPLSQRAARGAGTMAVTQIVRIALQLAGIVLLARLLMPSDYGLVAMATALVGIAEVLRDFGLAPAAIQSKTLSDAERSNLVWANAAMGFLLSCIVAAASWPIAALYGDPRLIFVVLSLSPVFFINGLSTQFRADLSRSMNFRALAKIDIASQVLAIATAVGAALIGWGYWAIVGQQLVQAIATLIFVVLSVNWRPRRFRREVSIRRFFTYGTGLLGTQLLVYATSNIDSVLIGARFGPTQLGLYNRAFQMLVLPLNQISSPATRVALPVLSRIQNDEPSFERYVVRGQLCLSWVVLPVYGFIAANSGSVVKVLLGDQWASAAMIFTLLAAGGMFQTLSYATYWIFLAKGLTASNLKFALITRTIMLAALCLGAVFSVHAVAAAYSISLGLIWAFGLIWISRVSEFRSFKSFTAGISILSLVGTSSIVSYLVSGATDHLNVSIQLVLSGGAFLASFAVLCVAVPLLRHQAMEIFSTLELIRRRKKPRVVPTT